MTGCCHRTRPQGQVLRRCLTGWSRANDTAARDRLGARARRAGSAATRSRRSMGGDEKVARHHAQGKLTVRERIDALLDPGSFHEIGALTGRATYDDDGNVVDVTPANFVMGRGPDRRPTGRGRRRRLHRARRRRRRVDLPEAGARRAHGARLAAADRPARRRLRAAAARSSRSRPNGARSCRSIPGWEHVVANLATVPVVSLCLGSVAGLGAARVVTSHYSVMVKGTSQLFVAGPPVVAPARSRTSTRRRSAAARIHTRNGAVDDEVATEAEAFARARRFLSYLPPSVDELPPARRADDDPERRDESLASRDPARAAQGLQDPRRSSRPSSTRGIVARDRAASTAGPR